MSEPTIPMPEGTRGPSSQHPSSSQDGSPWSSDPSPWSSQGSLPDFDPYAEPARSQDGQPAAPQQPRESNFPPPPPVAPGQVQFGQPQPSQLQPSQIQFGQQAPGWQMTPWPGPNPSAPYGYEPTTGLPYSDKSKVVAGVLQLLVGGLGVGRFYKGDIGIGVAQLVVTIVTLGIGALWPFIDGILMLTGRPLDRQGRPLRD